MAISNAAIADIVDIWRDDFKSRHFAEATAMLKTVVSDCTKFAKDDGHLARMYELFRRRQTSAFGPGWAQFRAFMVQNADEVWRHLTYERESRPDDA